MKNVKPTKNGIFQYRKVIPEHLRPILGKREFIFWLGTKVENEAILKAIPIAQAVDEQIEEARRKLAHESGFKQLREAIIDPAGHREFLDNLKEANKRHLEETKDSFKKAYQALTRKPEHAIPQQKSMTLTEAMNEFLRDSANQNSRDEVATRRFENPRKAIVKSFNEHMGKDVFITDIMRSDIRSYMEMRSKEIQPSSLNSQIAYLAAIVAFGLRELESSKPNPFIDMKMNDEESERRSFTTDEAKNVVAGLEKLEDIEDKTIGLLTAYTGCRLSEIVGLDAADISNGAIHIRPNEHRSLKTKSSRRILPITDRIKPLLEGLPKNGALFARYNAMTDAAGTASRFMNKTFLRKNMGFTDKNVTWHSWRHLMKDALRNTKCDGELRSDLLGHSKGTIDATYGDGFDLKSKKDAMDKALAYIFG